MVLEKVSKVTFWIQRGPRQRIKVVHTDWLWKYRHEPSFTWETDKEEVDNPEPVDDGQVADDGKDVGDLTRMDSELEEQPPVRAETQPLTKDETFPVTVDITLREWQPSVVSDEQSGRPQRERRPPS